MSAPPTLATLALAWHDVTCPEGPGCRDRLLHALSHQAIAAVMEQFLARLAELPESP